MRNCVARCHEEPSVRADCSLRKPSAAASFKRKKWKFTIDRAPTSGLRDWDHKAVRQCPRLVRERRGPPENGRLRPGLGRGEREDARETRTHPTKVRQFRGVRLRKLP